MRNFFRISAVALFALGLSASAQAAKKKPIDFQEFKGSYTGTVVFRTSGQAFQGTAQVAVSASKKGTSATVSVSGTVDLGGNFVPYSNVFTFSANKSFTQQDITYNIIIKNTPAIGTFSGKKNKVSFSGVFNTNGTTGTSDGTVSIRPSGKNLQKLALSTALSFNGGKDYFFDFDVSKKVKPKK